jgi:hypothetical protein
MRIIAWLILLIPGVFAGIGIKLMRDTFFGVLTDDVFVALWIQFLFGLVIFLLCMWFIGGFIFYHDRKRRKNVQKKSENG